MEQKLSDTLVKAIDRSNPFMQNLQLASRFNKLVEEGGGGADLEDNKEATIDVSAYTDPVEVTPTEGKDGMKKVTVTLDNIPSGMSGIMPIKFVGFKVKDEGNYYYVAFFDVNGNPITDKTLLNLENVAFAITNYHNLWVNYSLVSDVSLGDVLFSLNYDKVGIDTMEYIAERDTFYINSDGSAQETDSFANWSTAELIDSLELITVTPLP